MTQHRIKRAAVTVSAFVTAAIAAACTPYTQPATKSTPTMTHGPGTSASAMMSPDQRGAKGIKGSLEDDEKITQNYYLTLGWGDDLPDSAVWEGKWGANDTMIRLVPANTSPVVSWGNALGSSNYSGHLVMKIVVLEDKKVPELGLDGLDIGYLWIGQRGNGNSKGNGAAIYTLKPNGKAKLAMEMNVSGMCAENHGGRPMARARAWGECTNPIPPTAMQSAGSNALVSSYRMRVGPAPLVPRQGLWVTCPGGCCEVTSVVEGP